MPRGGGSSGRRQRRLCSNLAQLALVAATSSLVRSIGEWGISFISCLNPLIYCRGRLSFVVDACTLGSSVVI